MSERVAVVVFKPGGERVVVMHFLGAEAAYGFCMGLRYADYQRAGGWWAAPAAVSQTVYQRIPDDGARAQVQRLLDEQIDGSVSCRWLLKAPADRLVSWYKMNAS